MADGIKELRIALQMESQAHRIVETFFKLVLQGMKNLGDSDPSIKKIIKAFEEGNGRVCMVDKEDLETIRRLSRESGIPVYCMSNNSDVDFGYSRRGIVVTEDKYEAALQKVIDNFYLNKKMGRGESFGRSMEMLSKREFYEYAKDQRIMTVSGLGEAECMRYLENCRASGIPAIASSPKKGAFVIHYAEQDKEAFAGVRATTAIELAGAFGDIIRKHYEYTSTETLKNIDLVMNGKDREGKTIPAGTAFVGKNGKMVRFEDYTVHTIDEKGNILGRYPKNMLYSKQGADARAELQAFLVLDVEEPVMLTKEQLEEYQKNQNKTDFLIDIQRENGRPAVSKEDMETIANHIRQRDAIGQKLSQEYPAIKRVPQTPENELQSMFAFKEAEWENYVATHDRSEVGTADPVILDEARASYNGVLEYTERTSTEELEKEIFDREYTREDLDSFIRDMERDSFDNIDLDDI